jgi:hypothetical protein
LMEVEQESTCDAKILIRVYSIFLLKRRITLYVLPALPAPLILNMQTKDIALPAEVNTFEFSNLLKSASWYTELCLYVLSVYWFVLDLSRLLHLSFIVSKYLDLNGI